jgi:hypothetical protein
VVTSFSSKSELALNRSTSGRELTFMGYDAVPDTVDASNANTPGDIDPTNPVAGAYYRVVAEVNQDGRFRYTLTNAYSADNGRAAILNDSGGANVLYAAGNAGNESNPQPDGIITGAGAQILTPQRSPEALQQPGQPTPVGSFSVTQLGDKADKIGKDTNFRGLTIYHNQGQRQQRSQHRLLHRHHREGLPGRRRRSAARCRAADLADRLRPGAAADRGRDSVQHVHPAGLPDDAGEDCHRVPVRPVVRQR